MFERFLVLVDGICGKGRLRITVLETVFYIQQIEVEGPTEVR